MSGPQPLAFQEYQRIKVLRTSIAAQSSGCTRATGYVQEHCNACAFLTWVSEHQIPSILQNHKGKREIKGRKKSPKFLNSLMAQLLLNIISKKCLLSYCTKYKPF